MQAITKVFSDIVKPYIDAEDQTLSAEIEELRVNLLPMEIIKTLPALTYAGITFTVNEDGSFVANGTATGNLYIPFTVNRLQLPKGTYKYSGCAVGGSSSTYRMQIYNYASGSAVLTSEIYNNSNVSDNHSTFTLSSDGDLLVRIAISSGTTLSNLTFKPMIARASYSGDYRPYAMTNGELTTDKVGIDLLSEVGAVNYLNNTAITAVQAGVTFTVNDDKTVTANGSCTRSYVFELGYQSLKKGTYRLSGCPSGGSNTSFAIQLYLPNSQYVLDYGDGAVFKIDEDGSYRCNIFIYNGYTFNGQIFKPMIAPVSYTGDYVPYAKSNRDLTNELTVESGEFTRLVSFSTVTAYGIRKYGKVVELYFAGTLSEAVNAWTDFLTVPEGFRPSHYVQIVSFNTYSSCKNLQLGPSGGIQSAVSLASGDFIRLAATYIIN